MAKLIWSDEKDKTGLPYHLKVVREKGDPTFYRGGWGSGESKFLYWLKNLLVKTYKWDIIKKLMWKDGHLVSDDQHYLRSRYQKTKPNIALYNDHFAVTGLDDDWRENGYAELSVTRPWKPMPKKSARKSK